MENSSTGERPNSREGDQASYFYVVWPEETVTTISAAAGTPESSLSSPRPHPQRAAAPPHSGSGHHRQHILQNHDRREQHHLLQEHHQQQQQQLMEHSSIALSPPGGRMTEVEVGGPCSFASPLTSPILSIADASPLVAHSSAAVQTSPQGVLERTGSAGHAGGKLPGQRNSAIGPDVHRSSLSCDTLSLSSASQPTSPKISSHAGTGQTNSLSGSAQLNAFGSSSNNGHGHGLGGGGGGGGAGGGGSAGGGSSVHSDAGSSPVAAAEHEPTGSRRKRSRLHYYDLNGCLECEVKEAEIKTLRRRIQVMEEVVALLNQKMTALQQSTSGMLFSPMVMPPVVSQVMIPTTYSTSTASMPMKYHVVCSGQEANTGPTVATSPHLSSDNEDTCSDSASIAYAQSELCPASEHRVELIGGSGVYVTLPRLEEARREAKNGTQLARKLMDAFWDRETLARSSLSSKSKFQYQQLDPKVINTIEAYCLAFDSSTHCRDLHACMTDKCCQARSRRAAPFKTAMALQNGLQPQSSTQHNGLHNGINIT